MKKLLLLTISLIYFSLSFSQSNILVVDYNNAFSSDQSNNNSIIYNRLLATQGTVNRVASIPAVISNATYDQVWIFGNMGAPNAATLNPIVNFMNGGGGVYVQSEVGCCNNQAAYVDALINSTVTVGGSVTHSTTMSGYYQTAPSPTGCNPPNWVTHGAAARPFQGTPAVNVLFEANNVCGGPINTGDIIGVKFRSCDMISGQGALMSIGDFNVFPTAGSCTAVGILGTPNDNLVIDYIANLFPSLIACSNPSAPTMTTPNNIIVCAGDPIPASNFTSNPAGATFNWTNSNTAIGLAASGTGNTPAFNATNTGNTPITATITVTPTLNGCTGNPVNYTITVNPTPTANVPANATYCNGDPVPASNFTSNPAGATFNWTNSNTAIGLAASGTGNTPAFNATNTGNTPITATITVTPTLNGCTGNPVNYTITVNPTPTAPTASGATICPNNSATLTATAPGGNYEWFDAPTGGNLLGNGASYTTPNLTNTTTYYVQTTINGCVSPRTAVTVTIAPSLVVNAGTDDTICNGNTYNLIANPNGPGYSYLWDELPSNNGFSTIYNPTVSPTISTTYVVTITDQNNCVGSDSVTIYVNPNPTANVPANATYCNGDPVPASNFTSNPAGATFNWTNSNTAIGLAASGTGNTPAFNATNTGNTPITATITVTPTLNGCTGNPVNYTITVNPTPTAPTASGATICPNNSATLTATAPGGNYEWFDAPTGGNLLGNGASYTTPNLTNTTTYYVQTTINGCVSPRTAVTVTVMPDLVIDAGLNDTICLGDTTTLIVTPNSANYNYVWDYPGYPNFSNLFNPSVAPSATTQYIVTVTDQNGCTGIDSVTIFINPQLNATITSTNVSCNGACDGSASVNVSGGTGPYTYNWSSGGTTANETNLCPNLYSVVITDNIGCTISVDTTISEPLPLQLSLNYINNPLCYGDCNGSMSVNSSGGTAPYQYSLDGINYTASPNFNNLCSGNYIVTLQDINGCIDTLNLVLNDPALLTFDSIVSVDVSCNLSNLGNHTDGSLTIFAQGGTSPLSYSIDNGANFSSSNIFNNLGIGTYNIIIQDSNGCTINVGSSIINEPAPISIPNVITNATCNGYTDGQAVVAPQGGSPGYNYSWLPNSGNSPVASNLSAGPVTVTVTDTKGCSQDSTFIINEPPAINFISFDADTLSGCAPLQVNFNSTTDTSLISSIYWNLGNGVYSSQNPVTNTYNTPGSYDISLTITDKNGCSGTLIKNAYINVFDNPIADFSFTPSDITVFDPTVNFNDLSVFNISTWNWDFAGLGNSSQQHPSFTFPNQDTGTYPVTLYVVNTNGCSDSVTHYITVNGEHAVFVPNTFTPDGDGLNDSFFPYGFGVTDYNYGFYIFNRWGELIFESHNKFEPWDGTYKGKLVQNGVYVWKLNYEDLNGKFHKNVGHVNIIR